MGNSFDIIGTSLVETACLLTIPIFLEIYLNFGVTPDIYTRDLH